MKKELSITLAPFIAGLTLLIAVLVNLHLFENGLITVNSMLTIEVFLIFIGFMLVLLNIALNFLWIFQKKWKYILASWLSVIIFFACFFVAGKSGAAFLNAT